MGSGVSLTPMSPRGFLRWPLALHCQLGSGPGSFFFCALSTSSYSYVFPAVFFLLLSIFPRRATFLLLRLFVLYLIGYLIWNMIDCRICLYDIKSQYHKTPQLEFTPNLYRFHNPLEMDVSNLTLLTWTSLFGQFYSYLKIFSWWLTRQLLNLR